MITVADAKEAVTVVIPSGTVCRYLSFEMDMHGLHVPGHSTMARASGSSPAKNRNEAIRLSYTPWYFFCDDDQKVDPDLIFSLMKHDKPVVAAHVVTKEPVFMPLIFKGERVFKNGRRQWQPYTWQDIDGKRGLFGPVHAANGGVFLVKREVFDTIPDPWFQMGQYHPEECNEDLFFYEQCRKHEIPIYVDLDTRAGHISPWAAWPLQLPDGMWTVELRASNGEHVLMGRADIPRSK